MRRTALIVLLLVAAPAARGASLYAGPSPRPGPAVLYRPLAIAPQLSNAGRWKAQPILVSGANAYRDGEFLYQDFLYDDHGARELADPTDPRAAAQGDLFSKPNGTYTYPTGPGYANNAADLVEFRVKPLAKETAFRVTLNTLRNPLLIGFSIAIGGRPGRTYEFPDGANVRAPAALFLTVHPAGRRLVADLRGAADGHAIRTAPISVRVDTFRRQIEVDVPHADWNPRRRTVRLAMGVGLWHSGSGSYLLPAAIATATRPGGAGLAPHPAAFFNVGFRTAEPLPSVTASAGAVFDASWWRDRAQGHALAAGDISQFYANVDFGKLARRVRDDSRIPRTGSIDRILASHFQLAEGASFAHECGYAGASSASTCVPEYQGQLQPYAVYVPASPVPRGGYGMTLLLHSLAANYNQFLGTRNQVEFANRRVPSLVITPEARGPDQGYEGLSAADVFEVWADVAHRYRLNAAYTEIAGYSMGGFGTFKLAAQFPDLFARAQPTVGTELTTGVLASLRNVPVLMWNNSADELVNPLLYTPAASKLASLGYRYQLDVFAPCASPECSPLLPNHLELAINDQFAPAADFLDTALVDRNPAHVTYVVNTARDHPSYGVVGDHAYWISALRPRTSGKLGTFDAVSHAFGVGDATPGGVKLGTGSLKGGNMGTLPYASFSQTWSALRSLPRADRLDITATNIASATVNPARARVDCHVQLRVSTDGPLTVKLAGCRRSVRFP